MRKPLVVVCAAASALLLAGGVVATSADADERPYVAGWSDFWWPGLFGSDSSEDSAGDFDEDPFADRGVHERPTLDDWDDSDAHPQDDDDAGETLAQRPRAAQPGFAAQPGNAARPDAARRHDSSAQRPGSSAQRRDASAQRQAPSAQRQAPSVQRQAPSSGQSARRHAHRRGLSAQRPAANLMAGARRAVTARDVSASPAAPVQQRVLALVNHNRRRSGCGSLTLDRRLIEAANDHAADMARRRYFDHESPNGDRAGDRVAEAGYRWKRYGENIARGADSPWEVVDGWMNSRSHRRNILDCRLQQMGIGLAISRDRTPYWVQDFATPDA